MPPLDPFKFDQAGLRTIRQGSLRLGHWQPDAERNRRGQVVLLPGRGDFLEKYTPLAAFLNIQGYSVASLDWPGQGASGRLGRHPQAGHLGSYDEYTAALQACSEFYALKDKPQVWVAYSMGAPIAMRAALEHIYPVKGLVLLSPMFGFTEMPEKVLHILANTMCALGLTRRFALGEGPTNVEAWRVEDSQVSSSPEAFSAFRTFLQRHPDYLIGGSTWGWVKASLDVFEELKRTDLGKLRVPVLLISAQDEVTVSREAQQLIARRLPHAELIELPGKHDLLLGEPKEIEKLFRRISAFLEQVGLERVPVG